MNLRLVLGLLFLITLFSPYMLIGIQTGNVDLSFSKGDLSVLWFTVFQAFLSSVLSLILGTIAACSLLKACDIYPRFTRLVLRPLCLLPNIVPVLLVLLAALQVFNPFPFGLSGIVLLHALINIGIVAISLERIFASKLSGLSEVALLLGERNRIRFFKYALGVVMSDLTLIFLFVFALCYSSFAIPLIVGGSQATTMEVLIYEEIRISGNWPKALSLSIVQMLVLFVLCFAIPSSFTKEDVGYKKCQLAQSWLGLPFILIPVAVILIGLLGSFGQGWAQLSRLPSLLSELPKYILNSLYVGFGTGLLTLITFLVLGFIYLKNLQRRALLSYVAPSTVICGFALLFIGSNNEAWSLYRMILGLTLISVPALFRLQYAAKLYGIERQREVGETLGGTSWMLFNWIVLPQVFSTACYLSGIAAFWAWGDFALSHVVADSALTLSLLIQNLMGSYRLEVAILLVWIVILGGVLNFLFFAGIGYVYDKKFVSKI